MKKHHGTRDTTIRPSPQLNPVPAGASGSPNRSLHDRVLILDTANGINGGNNSGRPTILNAYTTPLSENRSIYYLISGWLLTTRRRATSSIPPGRRAGPARKAADLIPDRVEEREAQGRGTA